LPKRPLSHDELRVWSLVLKTVRPARGRIAPEVPVPPEEKADAKAKPGAKPAPAPTAPVPQRLTPRSLAQPRPPRFSPEPIEPGRKRRLTRERDPIEARIDLHGLDQFTAEDRLKAFLRQAQASGLRAVLVITGKGVSGDGVLRRRAPEWLADPSLSSVVAGAAVAHRRHGGEGAIYVALKRPPDRRG
jgi:DNA-nicking Smr family endonuclease